MPADQVTREVFWNISYPGELIFYALGILTLAIFGYGVSRNLKKVLRGKKTVVSWKKIRASLMNATT